MADNNFVVKNGLVVNTAFTANSTVVSANGLTVNSTSLTVNNITANGLFVNSTGVGIGTSSPSAKLDIAGNLFFSASNPYIYFNSNNASIGSPAGNVFTFITSGSERMRIDNGGNIGIGTASPAAGVHIADRVFRLTSSSGNPTFQFGRTNGFTLLYDVGSDRFVINRDAPIGSGVLTALYIDSAGNVGVNGTTTSSKLSATTTTAQNCITAFMNAGTSSATGMLVTADSSISSCDFFGGWKGGTNLFRVAQDGHVESRAGYYAYNSFYRQQGSTGFWQFYDSNDPDTGIWNYTMNMDGGSIAFAMSTSSNAWDYGTTKAYLDNAGNWSAAGNIIAYWSDKRLKTDITIIPNALDKVKSISGVTYKNNDVAGTYGFTNQEEQVGVLAQEIEAVLPQVVKPAPFDWDIKTKTSISGNNYKTVQYDKIVPLLIEAIKELEKRVAELEAK
jgi:hypothetical protein